MHCLRFRSLRFNATRAAESTTKRARRNPVKTASQDRTTNSLNFSFQIISSIQKINPPLIAVINEAAFDNSGGMMPITGGAPRGFRFLCEENGNGPGHGSSQGSLLIERASTYKARSERRRIESFGVDLQPGLPSWCLIHHGR